MSKNKVLAAAAAMLLAMPFAASAQQADERGLYVGVSIGEAKVKDFCDTGGVAGLVVTSCDNKASAYKAFVGYRAHRHFAIEGTLLKTDDFTAAGTFAAVPFTAKADGTAFGVAGVAILPVGTSFNLFGKLGFLSTEIESSATVGGASGSFSEDETEAHYGFGATYSVSRNWGVRAEWEKTDKSKIEMWSIGLQYRF